MAEAMDVEQPRGRIVKLEIEGFKSFGGTHTVDFRERQNFTAVVGPNGAGKSNLCLLYTSPSPRDRQKSRMPSSA